MIWAILRRCWRTKEINEWVNDADYEAVMSMDPERLEELAERNRLISENKTLCPDCGGELTWIEEYNCEKKP